MRQDQVSGGVSVLCWLAASVVNVLLQNAMLCMPACPFQISYYKMPMLCMYACYTCLCYKSIIEFARKCAKMTLYKRCQSTWKNWHKNWTNNNNMLVFPHDFAMHSVCSSGHSIWPPILTKTLTSVENHVYFFRTKFHKNPAIGYGAKVYYLFPYIYSCVSAYHLYEPNKWQNLENSNDTQNLNMNIASFINM